MYHSIWSATLPTHHLLPAVNASSPQETEDLNDASYAKYIRYLSPATVFRSKLPPPIADINTQLYLVSKDPYDSSNPSFSYESFDKSKHVLPDALWFQPYSKNPSDINYSITLGLIIEVGDIDAISVPIPKIRLSLTENNSMYLQSTIPLENVSKFNPTNDETNKFRLITRALNADNTQPIGTAFRDASKVLVPRFGNEHVRANIDTLRCYSSTKL